MTETAYSDLLKKIELSSRAGKLKTIKESVEQFYSLGKQLENLGKYKQAAECYEKVFKLLSDPLIQRYIKIRNKKLQEMAKEEKKRAVERLETEEDVYSELLSLDYILAELNDRIDRVESQK
ncbi:MAG: hypothetical protein P9L90_01140 [Candidatus Aadella gelida]|nr:hypothetical protein [Candidatus Aadella gelida]